MKLKKIISVALTASIALSFAGCSSSNKKFVSAIEDLDFEEMEYSDYKDLDEEDGDYEDGVFVVTSDEKEIKKLVKKMEFDVDEEDVASIVFAVKVEEDEDDYDTQRGQFAAYMISFKNAGAAEDAFDDMCDFLEDQGDNFDMFEDYGDVGQDDDDDYYILAVDADFYGDEMAVRMGVYLDGKDVICVISISYNDFVDDYTDLVDDFCDSYDLTNPSDAI